MTPTTHPIFEELARKVEILTKQGFSTRETMAIISALRITGDLVMSQEPFVCGHAGEKDALGCPEYVMISPAKGLSGFALYKKHTDYSEPGY